MDSKAETLRTLVTVIPVLLVAGYLALEPRHIPFRSTATYVGIWSIGIVICEGIAIAGLVFGTQPPYWMVQAGFVGSGAALAGLGVSVWFRIGALRKSVVSIRAHDRAALDAALTEAQRRADEFRRDPRDPTAADVAMARLRAVFDAFAADPPKRQTKDRSADDDAERKG